MFLGYSVSTEFLLSFTDIFCQLRREAGGMPGVFPFLVKCHTILSQNGNGLAFFPKMAGFSKPRQFQNALGVYSPEEPSAFSNRLPHPSRLYERAARDRFPKYGFCIIKSQSSRPLGIVFATVETVFLNFPVDVMLFGDSKVCREVVGKKVVLDSLQGLFASQQGSPSRWMFNSSACIGQSVHVALADSRFWTATELQEVLRTLWYTSGEPML
ncbi:hypothetical protein C8F01DRAFT_1079769 [Mycena amicta]|nr:hypothetical protein C8F01DRAFT_1079769 [Mycena amicta]